MGACLRTNFDSRDFSRLVAVTDAAPMLRMHFGSLSRVCREDLVKRDLAFLLVPPEGGQPKWFIHDSYDPRLRGAENQARYTDADLCRFSARQRDEALKRRACVEWLRQARVSGRGSMASMVDRIIVEARSQFPALRISRSRLYQWDALYQYPADLWKLADHRGGDRCSKGSDEAWAMFRDLYLHENQPAIRQCWREVNRQAAEAGWEWCSLKGCERQLADRIPPQEQLRHRQPVRYREQLAPFIAQHPESWGAGQLWIGDHKELDVLCRYGKSIIRPWVTTWLDWRTRKAVGWSYSACPNSTTILGALRHGMLQESNFGGPAAVWIDNGKDYDAWLFHGQTKAQRRKRIKPNVDEPRTAGILNALHIEAHFAIAYNPNGKARLERWFRTLETLCRTFDSYTGDGPETRPERLAEIVAKPHRIPAFETVGSRLAEHIAGYNGRTDHAIEDLAEAGVTLSPDDAYARWCDSKRVMADPKSLDLLLTHWHKPVTVGRNGIAINLCGRTLHYGQFDVALAPFKALKKADRRPVMIAYDPHDLRTVRVHDEQFRYVCTASLNQFGGQHGDAIAQEHVAELNREKALYDRSIRHVAEHSITSTLTTEEHLADIAARQKQQRKEQLAPAALQIVRTPMDGQAREIERVELKQAVGSESVSLPIRMALPSLEKLRRNVRPNEREAVPLGDPTAKLRERNHEW